MRKVATLTSKCRGQYLTKVGSAYKWLPVSGKITKSSKKVSAEGRGMAYISCTAVMKTKNGPKKMRVTKCSKKVSCDGGSIALLNSRVVGTRFRKGQVTSGSNKVSAN